MRECQNLEETGQKPEGKMKGGACLSFCLPNCAALFWFPRSTKKTKRQILRGEMKGGGLPELLSAIVVCIVLLFFLRLFHDFAAVNSLLSFKIPMHGS